MVDYCAAAMATVPHWNRLVESFPEKPTVRLQHPLRHGAIESTNSVQGVWYLMHPTELSATAATLTEGNGQPSQLCRKIFQTPIPGSS